MTQQKISLFVFCWMMVLSSAAQFDDLLFKHITRSNGLPINEVTCLAQDSSGFIWIGSMEGLFKYDGFKFIGHYANSQNKQSLPGNAIEKITVSKKGMLWIATLRSGVAFMTPDGKVLKVYNSENSPYFNKDSDYVSDIQEDSAGNIWWSTASGLFCLSTKGKLSRFEHTNADQKYNAFGKFFIDSSGKIWLTGYNMFVFDPLTLKFTHAASAPYNFKAFAEKESIKSFVFKNKSLWYSTWSPSVGVYDTLKKKESFLYSGVGASQPNYNRMVNCFFKDRANNLWIGTGEGLLFTTTKSFPEKTFINNQSNPYSIINNYIQAILEDKDGNMWFGTKNGISITNPYKKQVLNMSQNNLIQYPFGDHYIKNIIEIDDNSILLGTYQGNGFYKTDKNFKLSKHFYFKNADYDWMRTHYKDEKNNRILISTAKGILEYKIKTGNLKIYENNFFRLLYPISSIVATSDSIIWISSFKNTFAKYNLNNGDKKIYHLKDLGEEDQILHLTKDNQNNIWLLANIKGLLQFDEHTEKIKQKFIVDSSNNSLKQPFIRFFKDIGDYYIIGYDTKGISLYKKTIKKWTHITKAEGLTSNNTIDAVVDKDSNIWIATRNGLSHVNIQEKKIKNYGYDHGIVNNQFTCITQLNDGRIAAGTTKGIVTFYPSEINASIDPYAPIITEVDIHGDRLQVDSLIEHKIPVNISYKKNYLSIEYISLNYFNKENIQYAYKLEGVDEDWIDAGDRRFASYSHLKGGNYHFKVKARYPGGEWIQNKFSLPVIVQAAFYTKWWFFLLCAFAASLIVYTIFRYRLQQILALEKMRTSISNDLHDEVGASLTSISIFSEIARKHIPPSSSGEQYILRIGERSRESIEKMSDIIWSINPDNDNLKQMLVRMKTYATELCEAKEINVQWVESSNLASSKLSMEQRKNLYLVFKEIMNNILKHAEAKNIVVELKSIDNCIHLTIKDDGKGFDLDKANQGNGLKNLQRRTKQLNGQLNINSERDKGTIIQVEFRY